MWSWAFVTFCIYAKILQGKITICFLMYSFFLCINICIPRNFWLWVTLLIKLNSTWPLRNKVCFHTCTRVHWCTFSLFGWQPFHSVCKIFIHFNNYCPRSNYLHKLPIIYMYLLMLSGKYCMNLVDTDRSQYAREHGYRTSLCSLKPLSCTPKNNLIIGQRDSW